MEGLNIYQRLNEVRRQVEYLKRGSAGQGTGVLYDEVVRLTREYILEQGILITTDFIADSSRLAGEKKNYIYEAFIRVWYINMDDPTDKFSTDIVSHAMDAGDKAPGKAVTYAVKVSLVKVLFLETGINDESKGNGDDTPVPYNNSQFIEFHDLVNTKKAFALHCFVATINHNMYLALYKSFPKGQKGSTKGVCTELMSKGLSEFQQLIDVVDGMADKEDIAITEELEGFTNRERFVIHEALQPSTITFLETLKT